MNANIINPTTTEKIALADVFDFDTNGAIVALLSTTKVL